jgi:hypothetical protein
MLNSTEEVKMAKSATDVMQQIIFGAVVDAIMALKVEAQGMPNTLIRELGTINQNAMFADLPKSVQQTIRASTNSSFKQFLKEGFVVGPRGEVRQVPRVNSTQRHRRKPSTA